MIQDEDIQFILVEGRKAQFSNVIVKVREPPPQSHVTTKVQKFIKSTEKESTFKERLYVQI